jgi:uncharacterized protein (DUF697 family)
MTTGHRKLLEKTGIVKSSDSKSEAAVKMSLLETAGRAAVTATVTFAVGMILKRMFEKSVKETAAQTQAGVKTSSAAHTPPATYRSPARHAAADPE